MKESCPAYIADGRCPNNNCQLGHDCRPIREFMASEIRYNLHKNSDARDKCMMKLLIDDADN